jgi:hypothetical protein
MSTLDAAVLDCVEICADYRWLPDPEQTLRLIRVREDVRAGRRSEFLVSRDEQQRLRWTRWMVQRGLLGEQ